MKLPFIQFFTGDWKKDPEVSICSPATRGVWFDLLCAMHEFDRSGVLRGTREQLARTARCSTVELALALTDLQATGAADVTERNGIVTVINRRMNREFKARESTRLRVSKFRESGAVTLQKQPSSSEGESDSGSSGFGGERGVENGEVPDLLDFLRSHLSALYRRKEGQRMTYAEESALAEVARRDGVRDELTELEEFKGRTEYFPRSLSALLDSWSALVDRARAATVKTLTPADKNIFNGELNRIEARLVVLNANYGDHQTWTQQDREEKSKLKARRAELRKILGVVM